MILKEIDREILNKLQGGFPLTSTPYADAAAWLGIDEEELIARLNRMKESGVITRFGPFFDVAEMGGAFCLCAMAVPEDGFDTICEQVNSFEEVAHNYKRTHRLNMWFVLATETEEGIAQTAQAIEAKTGLTVWQFPKLKEFFVGFRVAA
ncbi:Lrp/AsnC family transcriptional regulator [Primorskyibacter sp. S187A]|uniref:Lrp/AsnC family transcriptional regulator n=1 Tax=Primorskyibacter sp. S187A TaxID=3415130 RepID=UPI003C7D6BB6